jgi:hypothetical protein
MTDQPFMGPVAARAVNTQCTNWEPYSLPQIWQMLAQETGQTSWAQVTAWGRMKSLCQEQARQLRTAADELAALWPPEKSEASRAYRDVVMVLARSLDDSANAAHANARALSALTSGISETRQKIARLVEQLKAREAEQTARKRNRLPFLPDGGLIGVQRSELDRAARQVMHEADVIPATATADFRIPADYVGVAIGPDAGKRGPVAEGENNGDAGPFAGSASVTWIPLPEIMPPPRDSPIPGVAFDGLDPVAQAGNDGQIGRHLEGTWDGSPILDGAQHHPSADVAASVPHPRTPPATASPWNPADIRSGSAAVGPGGVIGLGPIGSGGAPQSRPSSGVTSRPVASSAMPSMVTPPMGRTTPGHTGVSGAAIGRRRLGTNDPRDQWFVQEGLPPVIEPRAEPTDHDPGPGVIGIDR